MTIELIQCRIHKIMGEPNTFVCPSCLEEGNAEMKAIRKRALELEAMVQEDDHGREYAIVCHYKNEMETLRTELAEAVGVIEFYGDRDSWNIAIEEDHWKSIAVDDSGQRARDYLKKHEEKRG